MWPTWYSLVARTYDKRLTGVSLRQPNRPIRPNEGTHVVAPRAMFIETTTQCASPFLSINTALALLVIVT